MPEATFSELVHSTSSSDANATLEGACRTTSMSSSSGQYANSDLEAEGSASSGEDAEQPQAGSTQEPPAAQAGPSATAPPFAP